jgi:hypothetical protein
MESNSRGGRQNATGTLFQHFPPRAALAVSQLMYKGAQDHGDVDAEGNLTADNWRKIPSWEHMDHAISHAFLWQIARREGNPEALKMNLLHAACRLMMSLEVYLEQEQTT